ncbi:MAG: hypothetical protein L3K26_12855, partial [Candidatus Hydrogenedentes bacterium]|nr:hypothetical protein [Candidatus Hydrogenedentota bacterium]
RAGPAPATANLGLSRSGERRALVLAGERWCAGLSRRAFGRGCGLETDVVRVVSTGTCRRVVAGCALSGWLHKPHSYCHYRTVPVRRYVPWEPE